ncbi:unnamed protein product [Caenorhabditis sp. 36 PRJEB53466]|nr:unnamed protein product [Caenorhabditis sp. 36 PRJEB53466]
MLTFFKRSWGLIPIALVKILEDLLGSIVGWKEKENDCSRPGSKTFLTTNHVQQANYHHPFEASSDLFCLGIQSIVQDDLTRPFVIEQEEASLLRYPKERTNVPFYLIGFAFRWGFLFPLRVALMIAAIVFLITSATTCVFLNAEQKYFRYCAITFAKLFSISTGLILNFHDKKNRPKFPGVAVANHLSANDIMTIYAGCDYDGKGYTITGQTHGGYLSCIINDNDRMSLQRAVVEHSKKKDESAYPVLLFPEGYCSNSKAVLQFRKGLFDGHAPIYPIALKQDTRFGNAFWAENTYLPYLVRLMASWCSIIDICYLEPMLKFDTETDEEFAKRVQNAIATKLSVEALPFDGKLKSEKERSKYREKLQACFAAKQWGQYDFKESVLI